MTSQEMIWATRGHSWGFRFLRTAGRGDPLPLYEHAFADILHEPEGCARQPGMLAVRFTDPEDRTDFAGRPIVHDVILFGSAAEGVRSMADAVARVWPQIAQEYSRIWDTNPPST